MNINEKLKTVVGIAKEIEAENPVDWGMLELDEDDTYAMLGSSVLEHIEQIKDDPDYHDLLAGMIVCLVVDNFVANTKLLRIIQDGHQNN